MGTAGECPKCAEGRLIGPSFVEGDPHDVTTPDQLCYTCTVCGFKHFTPTKDDARFK